MKPRERVIAAIKHEEPDRVPLCGFAAYTEMTKEIQRLCGATDIETMYDKLGVDIRGVHDYTPESLISKSSIPPEYLQEEFRESLEDFWGWVPINFDEWGIERKYLSDGKHWIISKYPLQHAKSPYEIDFPDLDAPGRWDKAEEDISKYKGKYFTRGGLLVGFVEEYWYLRGFNEFIRDLYTNENFANGLLDRLLEWNIEKAKKIIKLGVDCVSIADDTGGQTGMLISPSLWRKYMKPRYKKLISEIKKTSNIYFYMHSDGNIEPIIPDLIEAGVDILSPMQPDTMDLVKIKKLYGEKFTMGGTISVQETLPFGTKEDVINKVKTRIETLGTGGGLILCPGNMVEYDTPPENLLAVYQAALTYGKYKSRSA